MLLIAESVFSDRLLLRQIVVSGNKVQQDSSVFVARASLIKFKMQIGHVFNDDI